MPLLETGFGIYIHWPFCKAKCPYCDFNSHVRDRVDHKRWRQALLTEIDYWAACTPARTVTSVFFGGGTPSLMEPETVAAIIEHIGKKWLIDSNLEVTLEANPTSVEAERFRAYREAGVNRVSLGIQSLDNAALKFLGREHSAEEALKAIAIAAQHFPRFSFDLIYARPNQTIESWRSELRQAVALAAGHLSVYQLTIESGTQFYTLHARGDLKLPDDDLAGAFYEVTQEELTAAGLPAYEVSNHARPGQECRHNLTYWRMEDYIGIGPGAHGRISFGRQVKATKTHRAPEIWLSQVEAQGQGIIETSTIHPTERVTEILMMGLRLQEGIPLERLEKAGGKPWKELINSQNVGILINKGFLQLTETHLIPTSKGLQLLESVLGYLLKE